MSIDAFNAALKDAILEKRTAVLKPQRKLILEAHHAGLTAADIADLAIAKLGLKDVPKARIVAAVNELVGAE